MLLIKTQILLNLMPPPIFMTVIVGLETNVGEKAVVMGSDKLAVHNDALLRGCIAYLAANPDYSTSNIFDFLEKKGRDKIRLNYERKIQVSDNYGILTHTGSCEESHNQISRLLLKTGDFLGDESLLKELLFPLGYTEELAGKYLGVYKKDFSLDRRLERKQIPEIRRIFDIHTAKLRKYEAGPLSIALWDRNYHPVLSEYLFAKLFQEEPKLFEITVTGAVTPRQYFANGCGKIYAFEHMRHCLETSSFNFFYDSETEVKKDIDLETAVKVVKGAIEYASYCSPFCKGFDYAVLTKDKIETHFSEETFSYELDVVELIDRRLNGLKSEQKSIGVVKTKLQKR